MKKLIVTLIVVIAFTKIFAQAISSKNPAIGFVENKGQIIDQNYLPNTQVKYLLSLDGLNVQLKANSFSYDSYVKNDKGEVEFHRIDIELANANPTPKIETLNPSLDYINYYTTGTAEEGVLNVRHFSDVIYKNIYAGIDLHFKANVGVEKIVEYDFIVHPGADASQIKLKYIGAFDTKIANGKVVLKLAHGNLSETIPASYLLENNQEIIVSYKHETDNLIAFNVSNYDKSKTLVIDPNPDRDWGTFYGGTSTDDFRDVVTDATNVYAVGMANSTTSIATTGAHQTTNGGANDAMIVKFNTAGVRQWATYYGGALTEESESIAQDLSANIYVVGRTQSTTNISTTGAYQTALSGGTGFDAFLVKFNTSGVRQFGTYFGGTGNEFGYAVNVRSSSVYFGGNTTSTSGISTTGAYLTTLTGGAYVAKFNTSGTIQWATYYQANNVYAITTDASGNLFFGGAVTSAVVGTTTAGAHQTTHGGGANDGFVAKFTAAGARTWATYYGGSGDDNVRSIKTNSTGNAIFGGITASTTGIAANTSASTYSGGSDGFIANIDASGVRQWG